MTLIIKWLRLPGNERRQANSARGIPARRLEISDLVDQFGLARAQGSNVQGINMIEHSDQYLQPFILCATQFFHFEPECGLLTIVDLLHERRKSLHLRGHAFSDASR